MSAKISVLDSTKAPHQAFRQIADDYEESMQAAIGIIMERDGSMHVIAVGGIKKETAAFMLGRLVYELNDDWHGPPEGVIR